MSVIKKIQPNGNVCIPKKLKQQLTSDEVEIKVTEINGKKVIVLEPTKEDKKLVVMYE